VSRPWNIEIMIILNARVAPPNSPAPPARSLTTARYGVPVTLVHGPTP
jgi:hypothetical protein